MNTKPYGTAYAVLKTSEHLINKEKIEAAEYFRFRLHGANVRARELGSQFVTHHIKVKSPQEELKGIEAIILESDEGIYAKVSFFDNEQNAMDELIKALKKFPDAVVLKIDVVTNMTKEELRS